ncbi:cyclic nucleotide-binding domain-containing protein, partial [Xanthomonas sp. Kuri4-2]
MDTAVLPTSRTLPLSPCDNRFSLRLCSICDVGDFCLAEREAPRLRALDARVEHSAAYLEGSTLFRAGDALTALTVVRTGTVKLFTVEPCGSERILGFAHAGDAIGLDAIHAGRHACHAVALETTSLCQLSFAMVTQLIQGTPPLQRSLLNLLSRQIAEAHLLLGRYTAEQRLATLFLRLSRHARRRGLSATRLRLGMPRGDIANYLRLTPETISRLLR